MKSTRHKSREFALQALYQWQLSGGDPEDIAKQLREVPEFSRCDDDYFVLLLRGAVREVGEVEREVTPFLDRKYAELSPIERGIIMLAGYELLREPKVPYRVVINEAVELAKSYGGTDGHKFVNGVLDKLAGKLRDWEVPARGMPAPDGVQGNNEQTE